MTPPARRGSAWRSLIAPLLLYGAIALPLFLWTRALVHPLGQAAIFAISAFGLWRLWLATAQLCPGGGLQPAALPAPSPPGRRCHRR